MFSKPYFAPQDQDALFALQYDYLKALLERSNNPGDFAVVIECLKKFETMHIAWKKIIQPYLDKEKNRNTHYFKIGDLEIDIISKSKSTAVDKSKKILFPKKIKDFIAKNVTTDPRISKIGVFEPDPGPDLDYFICFSDGSQLKFNTLTDKTELDITKVVFIEKMLELEKKEENANRLTIKCIK